MRNIKLTIEFDGTNYNGWQTQKNKTSIQETIESALKLVMNEEIELTGSSRTDAGVHALGLTANFKTMSTIATDRIPRALNSVLPKDIVIKDAEEKHDEFHARFCSIGKKYKYTIVNDKYPSALIRNYAYFFPYKLDIEAMQNACKYLLGDHDFSAFKSSGGSAKTSIRTIYSAEFVKRDNIIEFYIHGNAFLYNMVRIIVGTLLDVGQGKIKPEQIEEIILSGDRKKAGKTAPPYGLCLVEVYY